MKVDSGMKFEIQRIVLSSIENYINPLKREIIELKSEINKLKKLNSEPENEPVIITDALSAIDSQNMKKISNKINSSRNSIKRNLLRDTRNFVPLSTKNMNKKLNMLKCKKFEKNKNLGKEKLPSVGRNYKMVSSITSDVEDLHKETKSK